MGPVWPVRRETFGTVTSVTAHPTSPWVRGARIATGLAWPEPATHRLRAVVAGRTVLVTGASSGIGEATAYRLAAAGAHLLLVARREPLLQAVAARVVALGGTADVYPCDLSDVEAVGVLVDRLRADQHGVDVVVANAGHSIRRAVELTYDRFHDYTRTINVNYLGPVRLLLGLLPAMRAAGRGQIVYVSTVGVDLPGPSWSAYAASKNAFETWLRSVSPEVRGDGVATTSVHFGLVHTAMSAPTALFRGVPGMTPDEAAGAICRAIVRRPRMIRPWWATLGALGATAAPGLTDRIMAHAHENEHRMEALQTLRQSRRLRRQPN
jgi:short-subunit dehydrogenase